MNLKKGIKVFDTNYYLLGKDKKEIEYYLEEPHWDCGWYWRFGYIETFNKNFTDINSHQHARDFYPKWILGKNSILVDTPFTEKELWLLSEYFKEFYLFKELAEFYYTGTAGIANPIENNKNKKKWEQTNKKVKDIIDRIMQIITGNYKIKTRTFRKRSTFDKWCNNHGSKIISYEIKSQNNIKVKYIEI